jgi:hypothetical protein
MSDPLRPSRWTWCWSLVVTSLVGFSFLVWHPVAVLLVLAVLTFFVAAVLTVAGPVQDPDRAPVPPLDIALVLTRATACAATAVGFAVLAAVSPALALGTAVLAAVTSAPVQAHLSGSPHRSRPPWRATSRRPPAEESTLP